MSLCCKHSLSEIVALDIDGIGLSYITFAVRVQTVYTAGATTRTFWRSLSERHGYGTADHASDTDSPL